MKKKFIALILAVIMTATCVGAGVLNSPDIQLVDVESGESVSTVEIPRSERSEIAVDYDGSDLAYQWQLSSDGKTWINVYGQTEESIKLSYAMVCNMLSDDGTAQVRCIVTDADNKYESNTAEVSFVEDKAVSAVDNSAAAKPAAPAKAAPQRSKAVPTTFEGEVKETIVVTINYLFQDGTQAANPWTATVPKDETYAVDVKSPEVVGYKPAEGYESVHVDTSKGGYNYTVYYYPAEVNFTVRHYQQNIDNDNYTLVDTETKTGTTKSPVGGNLGKNYTGFYALLYDTTTEIAADGSTVVEIYYDREYYLLSLDLAGGYGSEPMYAKYGTPVSVADPKRTGYDFTGWSPALPATIATNTKHTAQWKAPGTAKVTVVVWGENPDDEKYSYIKTATDYATPEQEFSYKTCTKEAHEHTAECGCIHYGTHSLIPSCYNVYGDAVDPDTFGDHDATKHFLHECTKWPCKNTDLSQYLVNGSVCHYRNGNGGTSESKSEHAYWLYLNGRYYSITKDQFNSFKTNTGDSVDHGNDTYEVYKGKTSCQHKHTDNCCTCGKSEHSHNSDCFNSVSFGMDSKLWKLADCDTVTVAADGSSVINVYYDRVQYDVKFYTYEYNPTEYTQYRITAKWGQNILDKWPTHNRSSSWYVSLNGDIWQNSIQVMPVGGASFYGPKTGSSSYTASFYVEVLPGESGDVYYNGKYYKLHHKDISSSDGNVTDEDHYEIKGFTHIGGTANGESFGGAKFYYDRNSYKLEFFNNGDIIDGRTQTVKFEAPLSSYNFKPDYPSNLEPNAYEFAGWYTTAECYAGSEADLSTMTMPASNVILYAKWVPKTHTVKTYLTKDAMDNGSAELQKWTVTHGSTVTDPPADPERKPYKFVGWFYDENGTEKAFDFSMPVNRDLNLYAKWSSNTLVEYKIHYRLEDGTEIAPDATGSGLAGTTKTFDAKTGTQLNDGYQTGYFPQTGSHSLTFDINGGNEFTFVYVPKKKVKYTVKYLEKGTEAVLHKEKSEETSDAVKTEKFEYIKGYAPDAYQKKLVLSADENKNVLIFWYTKDDTHAPVQTIHWIQNIVGDGYTEYQSSTDLNGVIGNDYSATPISITGFKFNSIKSNTEGKLPETGLVLNLFYDREEYGYIFRFMEKGTTKQLAAPVTGTARYQAQVTESAKTIDGYKLVSNENQLMTIGTDAKQNVKTFWYKEKTAVINYEVVGPEGCGSVSRTSETVNMVTGTANGSTATASNNAYKFVGWYSDEACTTPVSSDAEFVPTKSGTLWPASTTYYAKFDWNVADLTITKTGAKDIDKNQSFIFHVTGEGKDMYVTVQGNGSVTIKGLTVGTYTVEEVTSWSWRYKPDQVSKNVEVKGGQKNEVTFNNSRTNGSWLSGDSFAINSVLGRH